MITKQLTAFKMLSATLALALVLSAPLQPIVVFAQEEGETVTQTESAPSEPVETTEVVSNESGPTGETGETGTSAGEDPVPDEGDGSTGDAENSVTTVETGDATAGTDTGNDVNTTEASTEGGDDVDITASSTADLENTGEAEAATGDNTASGGEGGAAIGTGDALATGNAINVVNTNIIDSTGMLLFLNLLFGENYDFRNLDLSYFFGGASSTMNGCSLLGCGGADVTVNASNTATVLNSVIVRAMTGGNTCTAEGDCTIGTGDAYAAGNAVNLVNSNIIDSNYLLVSFNSFGDMGDIVLPGAEFFEKLLAQQTGASGELTVNATNTALVTDSTEATADSGNNAATSTSDGSASVTTGNAIASATSYNQVNSTLIGGTQVFLLFRIWGDWGGSVTGLPDGMTWRETPYGIELVNADGTLADTGSLADECCDGGSLEANLDNAATVENNVKVWALTGENKAESEDGDASIATGDAYASANSVNLVNTNLIGRNWIFMIFNIFGNFSGNISFGRPDLWLGAVAETANPTLPGSSITYKFTVANRGDSDATNVKLTAKYLKELLSFDGGVELEEGKEWVLGTIPRGETREFTFTARAGDVPQGQSAAVPLTATVTSSETDNNTVDNTEALDIVILNPGTVTHTGPGRGTYTGDPKLTVYKVADIAATKAPAEVEYAIIIKNDGGNAYDVKVHDALVGPLGNVIGTQTWNLDTVYSGEEVRIEYTVAFGADIKPGIYTNTAIITGTKNFDVDQYATNFTPVSVQNRLEIRPRGEVLAAAVAAEEPAPQCEPLITETIRPNRANDADQVTKLQSFLKNFEGASDVEGTGVYDSPTIAAVKSFQTKYLDEILLPWGITTPTGHVYHTTKKKVNELYCEGKAQFDLTDEQWAEINSFRKVLPTDNLEGILKNRDVGGVDLGGQNIAQPKKVDTELIPVSKIILDLEPAAEEAPTSTIIRETQSFLRAPMNFFAGFLLSMVPLVEAMEN